MRHLLLLLFPILMLSCKTVQGLDNHEHTRDSLSNTVIIHDTIFKTVTRHDSVFIKQIEREYLKGDTVFVERNLERVVDNYIHDTIYLSQNASNDFQHKQESQKQEQKTIVQTKNSAFANSCIALVIGVAVLAIVYFILRLVWKKRSNK